MKIYFNQVPDSDVQFFDGSGLFGPNDYGNFFYNYVEYGSNPGGLEEVMIVDGCDREIPVNMEAVPDLIRALEKSYEMWMHIKTSDSFAYSRRQSLRLIILVLDLLPTIFTLHFLSSTYLIHLAIIGIPSKN
jgi:hypothetical protein